LISRETIRASLGNCLTDTSGLGLPGLRRGKVRDIYDLGDRLLIVTTDRQSAFDRIIASVPFKGQVLNQVSAFWFESTYDIVRSSVIEIPDPCATIAEKCSVLPVEFIVRGYLTGSTATSAWTLYREGVRDICGNRLPDGMVKNQRFARPILTPTTKSDIHDEPLTPAQIVDRGLMTRARWEEASEVAMRLYDRGVETAASNGLVLVDTKYEMGLDREGRLTLIDEVHTPDSSRYWLAGTLEERLAAGLEPENIDKEFLRLWFVEHCDPYGDAELPKAPDDLVVELSSRYISLYEMITGGEFAPAPGEPLERLRAELASVTR